ncbi:MAG: prepilin-type N-terminal cleavage/methylation domain-containing protein [Nitrospirota bacterium]
MKGINKNTDGFTLMEILIAMTILSMITLIIGLSFNLGIKAWDKGEADIENLQRMRFYSERISQQIKSAYPYQIDVDGKKKIAFKGESESLWFVTASDTGVKWISYSLKGDDLLFAQGTLPDKKVLEKIQEEGEIIDAEISQLKFEYYSTEDKEWKDSWDFNTELPYAVKMRVDKFQPVIVSLPIGTKTDEDK